MLHAFSFALHTPHNTWRIFVYCISHLNILYFPYTRRLPHSFFHSTDRPSSTIPSVAPYRNGLPCTGSSKPLHLHSIPSLSNIMPIYRDSLPWKLGSCMFNVHPRTPSPLLIQSPGGSVQAIHRRILSHLASFPGLSMIGYHRDTCQNIATRSFTAIQIYCCTR